uniref:DUF19 domain-containing protein n=1 Tax=Globodera pallida TaxID=36090 RepID=A0A183BSC9_GLOPA
MLNVSAFPYGLVCEKHESLYTSGSLPVDEYKDYVNACMQVPTEKCQFHVDVYACYKSSNKWPRNSSIAELCREHLDVDSTLNVAGFRNDGIGSVLDDIGKEKINGTWAKKLHFVPPSTADMEIYFQIANPEFSRLITQSPNVRPSENNPNTTWNTYSPCDDYGDDCDEIRELLKRIEDLESCHGNRPPLPDDAFKLPPWKKPPPYSRPFRKRSESLICNFDSFCHKEELHEEYIEARERCGLAPEEGNRRKKRH